MRAKTRTLGAMASVLLGWGTAHAGYLTIQGKATLDSRLVSGGKKILIFGKYSIDNQGDETAKAVFPSLEIGQWLWTGEPRDIDATKATEWPIEQSFDVEKLNCPAGQPCSSVTLPTNGAFPVFVRRYY